MEEYKIIGRRILDYTNKQGRHVEGINLFVTSFNPNVVGEQAGQLFVSKSAECYKTAAELPIGTKILVSYNRYGSVASITAKLDK